MAERIFKRGEIYWVNLEERTQGAETQKNRPAIITSNNKQNQFSGVVIVALITSQVDKIYPFEIAIELENKKGKILTDQIYTIDKRRLGKRLKVLSEKQLKDLSSALHIIFDLRNCREISVN